MRLGVSGQLALVSRLEFSEGITGRHPCDSGGMPPSSDEAEKERAWGAGSGISAGTLRKWL